MAGSFFNIIKKAAAGVTKSSKMVAKGSKSAVSFISRPSSRNGVYDVGIKSASLMIGGVVVSSAISMKGSEESLQRIAKLNKLAEFSQQVDKGVY